MTILYDSPPADSLSELNRVVAQSDSGARIAGMPQMEHIDTTATIRFRPHGIYASTLADAAAGKAVRDAKLVVWRYLMKKSEGNKFSIEVNFNHSKKIHKFSRINIGPRTASMHALLETAERDGLELPKDSEYTVRGLRIPELFVEAAWFHSSAHDVIMILAPSILGKDVTETAFTVEAFESLMETIAKDRLENSDNSPGA